MTDLRHKECFTYLTSPLNVIILRHIQERAAGATTVEANTDSGDQGRRISKRKTTALARITKDLGYVEQQKASDAVGAEDKSSERDGE